MKRKPKDPNAPILSKFISGRIVVIALTMAILALGLYHFYEVRYGENYARTIVFCALVVMQWANALNARSDYQSFFGRLKIWNGKFFVGIVVAILLQLLAIFGPLQGLLHITSVTIGDLVITGFMAFAIPIAVVEVHKYIGRHFYHKEY